MNTATAPTANRVMNWVIAGLLGIPGIYDLVSGISEKNAGTAVYGLGTTMCALFFVLGGANKPSQQASPTSSMVRVLGYAGVAVLICGFLLKRGWI